MRKFNYSILNNIQMDNKLIKYISKIYEAKGKQELYLKQKPFELDRLIEIAKIQSTESSNAIEGIKTTTKRIADLINNKTTPKNRDEQEIAGYRDALNIIHERFEYIPITTNYILQLHKILYSHNLSKDIGGKLKQAQNYIEATDNDGNKTIIFKPIEPAFTHEALDNLCAEFNRAISAGESEPLLLIFSFIHDFLCIHPFSDGNGRMSRLLTTLLLYRSGFLVSRYISLEAIISKNKDLYYESLHSAGIGWDENKEDITTFIKYMLNIVYTAYVEFEDRVDMVRVKLTAEEQVLKALDKKIGKTTKSEILELCPNISASSVEKQISRLVENGKLTKVSKGRSSFYIINE